jgi:hypothetical protein
MHTLTADQAHAAIREVAEQIGRPQTEIAKLLLKGRRIPLATGAELELTPILGANKEILRHVIQIHSYSIDCADILPYTDPHYQSPYEVIIDGNTVKTFYTLKAALSFIRFITDHLDCPRKIELIDTRSAHAIITWYRTGPGEWSQKG